MIYYFMYVVDGWFGAMFIAGMLLCDLDLLAAANNLPKFFAKFQPYKTAIFYSFFIIAMFLSGVPSQTSEKKIMAGAPGWKHLLWLKPDAMWDHKWFFLIISAVMLISSIPRIWWLRAFFESSFNQYLGRISFSLYLVHGPILWTLGDRLYAAVGWYRQAHEEHTPGWVNAFPLSHGGPMGLEPALLIPQLIILPVTLWVAEIVTKICDENCLKFTQWVYHKAIGPQQNTLELRA
jgi:hypothetical protein